MDSLSPIRLEFENIEKKAIKILYLRGKITALSGVELNKKLHKIFDDLNYNVIIDISNVEYMDSKGMAMLLTLAKTIERNNGKLLLTRPSEFVKDLLDLTNLTSFFSIVNDLPEARKKIIE